uniref:Uncharacterized protein n=1 Tax=Tanacetum cinerariifolium TaxID=118510 RepID=A0A699GZ17_TANCI|nr:hypothetical protein [Tanacetum cinerariifolium]
MSIGDHLLGKNEKTKLKRLLRSKMSFHQELDLLFELDETTVECTRDILRQRDSLDQLSEVYHRLNGQCSSCGEMDMVIKDLDLEAKDVITKFCSPSRWKELSKETSSKILPCGDGSCWKAFKPTASLIVKGKLK